MNCPHNSTAVRRGRVNMAENRNTKSGGNNDGNGDDASTASATGGYPGAVLNMQSDTSVAVGSAAASIASVFVLEETSGVGVTPTTPGVIIFVVDSGCSSSHIVSDFDYLRDVHPCGEQVQAAGDNNFVRAEGIGTVTGSRLYFDDTIVRITLTNVLWIPSMKGINVISSTVANKHGVKVLPNDPDGSCCRETSRCPFTSVGVDLV